MPGRVSSIVRLRAELDELQDSCADLSAVSDVVVRHGIPTDVAGRPRSWKHWLGADSVIRSPTFADRMSCATAS